jgi:hypothetical protein
MVGTAEWFLSEYVLNGNTTLDIVSALEMNSNRKVSMQQSANIT